MFKTAISGYKTMVFYLRTRILPNYNEEKYNNKT